MTRRVLIVGGSDQGRQVIDILERRAEIEIVGVLDSEIEAGTDVYGHPVLGRDHDVAAAVRTSNADSFVVAIGDNFTRGCVTDTIVSSCPGLDAISAVHPSAVVSRRAQVGQGSIVMAGAVISNGCIVGRGGLLGTNSSIDHDTVAGEFVSLGPGATTGGTVRIGDCSAIGLGASVIHHVTIGAHTVVGSGALVLDDIGDHVVAFGEPAVVQRRREPGEPYLQRGA
jgi:sugar O-acyltransferase (sialic acid O-acetyltransferase NeuD family)